MFSTDTFIADCQAALQEDETHVAVREVVARAVADPAPLLKAIGEPAEGGVQTIHAAPDLTIINVIWSPFMTVPAHNHNMWAVIGVYTGREDNIFWRRTKDDPEGNIEAAGARSLGVKDAVPLGKDIIHSVTNPLKKFTGAIHVYGGDFFHEARSQWEPETLSERAYDISKMVKVLEN